MYAGLSLSEPEDRTATLARQERTLQKVQVCTAWLSASATTRVSSEDAVSTSPSPAHPLPLDDGLFFAVKRMEVDPALMWTTRSCLDDEGPFIVFTRSSFQPVVIKHTAGIGLEVQHNTFLTIFLPIVLVTILVLAPSVCRRNHFAPWPLR